MPIAFLMLLLACLLPMSMAAIAKIGRFRLKDNRNPREWRTTLDGYRARAYAAQDNTFEALPFFIAGVLVSYTLRGDHDMLTYLSMAFVALRIGYNLAYLFDKPSLRSVLWGGAYGCCIALFFV